RCVTQLAQGRHLDQLAGDLAQTLLQARLARLPARATQAVKLNVAVGRTVACQKLDVLDRKIELVATRVADLEAIVGCAQRRDRGETAEAPDAVTGMHNEIADGEARCLSDDVGGAPGPPAGANETVAQNVLLADDREMLRLDAFFDPQHRQRRS